MANYGFISFLFFSCVLISVFVDGTLDVDQLGKESGLEEGLSELMKEEVQDFKKEVQKSFITESSRRKRSYSRPRYTYDIKLDQSSNYLEARVSSNVYPFVCHGQAFVIQSDGIYRLDGFIPGINIHTENVTVPRLTKISGDDDSQWTMDSGDRVLHVKEWEQKCFVLVSKLNGTFSYLYTLHGTKATDVFSSRSRQRIRNIGFAMSAKFFILKRNLYLIIANDNAVHSLTICPLFRWAGTYMDKIHAIQTRGAVAVETFTINSKEYIAIAQSQDAAGNYEVGTQILKMDHKGELEKVQLLWSNNPVALQYVQVLEEHYLIIGLAKEPSIVYTFGGIDFIHLESLGTYMGQKLFMDSFLLPLPDKGPVVLAAKNTSVHFYTWSTSALTLNNNASALAIKYPERLISARFIRPSDSQIYLTAVLSDNSRTTLKVFPLSLVRKEIAESQIKQTESQVSQCLVDVRRILDEEGKIVSNLEDKKSTILTVYGDVQFNGTILTSGSVIVNPYKTTVDSVNVAPQHNFEYEIVSTPPSQLLELATLEVTKLRSDVTDQLPNVLMKSKPGSISGDYVFPSGLDIAAFRGDNTNLQITTLNGNPWSDIKDFALRRTSQVPQRISGSWTIDILSTNSVVLSSYISNVEINNFLLKQCSPRTDFKQEINNVLLFKDDINFNQGVLMPPNGLINGILISDVVLKNSPILEIKGYKHTHNIISGDGFSFNFINDKNFPDWFKSVMHTDGLPQSPTGLKTLISTKGNKFENLQPIMVNSKDWAEFYSAVLTNGTDQFIEGDFQMEKLDVEGLEVGSIANVLFEDLMTIMGNQTISSRIKTSSLTAQKNLNTTLVNGILLATSAVTKNEEAVLNGPVELENFKVNGSVSIVEGATIGGKDISEIAKLRRKHMYHTTRGTTIFFRAPVVADRLETSFTNDHLWEDLGTNFWSRGSNNVIQGPLDLVGRKIHVQNQFDTLTLNYITPEFDIGRIDEPESINSQLLFIGDVRTFGNVHQVDKKTLNGLDFSEISLGIVKVNEAGLITGKKHFKGRVVASGGSVFSKFDGMDLDKVLVFLNSEDIHYLKDLKYFKNKVYLQTLDSESDITVHGKVNGYDLVRIWNTTAFSGGRLIIPGNVAFNESFHASYLYVRNELNGVNVTDLHQNAIYLNHAQKIHFPLAFHHGVLNAEHPSVVNSINGINLEDYLSRVVYVTPPDRRINGTKTFVHLKCDKDIHCRLFNGISLENLTNNAFSLTEPQNINGKMYFDSITVDSNLQAHTVDGLNLNELIFVNDPESFEVDSDILFSGSTTKLNGPLTVGGLLNGYPVEYLAGGKENEVNHREFMEVEVEGELHWDIEQRDISGISNFYINAVTLDTDQVITGKVEFEQGFHAGSLESYPWINDVNLEEIQQDAVQEGESPLMLTGKNTFATLLTIQTPPVNIDVLDAHRINGVTLKELDKHVIQTYSDGVIYGTKLFSDGIDATHLYFKDLGNKGDFHWLVTASDNRAVDRVEFNGLAVDNLNYNISEGFELEKLLNDRVLRDGDQVLYGNYTVPALIVQNQCKVHSINHVPVADIFLNTTNEKQRIDGDKTFTDGVIIDGEMDSPEVNGYNFEALHSDVYRRTDKVKINRPVVFVQPVVVNQSVQVDKHINDYRIAELSARFSNALKGIESRALVSQISPTQNLDKIEKLKENLSQKPIWLEYLRLKQNWGILGPKSRVEYTPTEKGSIIGLHEQTKTSGVSWPGGCQCNSVQFVRILGTEISASTKDYFPCYNAFIVTSTLGNIYSVLDQSVSYNQTCNTNESASLIVAQGVVSRNTAESADILRVEPSKGYLSDVKAFSDNGFDYVVLTYFFDAKNRNHDSAALIYKVDKGTITLIQTIATAGAVRLAITNMKNEWVLAIANSRDPKTDSCSTNSAIFRWSSSSQTFNLLRDVRTNGALDVTFIHVQDKSVNYNGGALTLVAFAQSGNSGDGEVTILLYDDKQQNFYTIQSLRTPWGVSAVEFFCIQENCFLLIVIPQEGVKFYEYRYVEGFQLSLSVPVVGAQDVSSFPWGSTHERALFAIASSKTSILAEGVVAGQSHEYYSPDASDENTPYTLLLDS